jgi:DNA-binding ferritin-like protein (Dps family)
MGNVRDLKKDINYVLGDIIGVVSNADVDNSKREAIIDEVIATFDALIAKVNDRSVENKKSHFKAINKELEDKGHALIEKINKL